MAEPIAPKKFEFKDMSWTLWDQWVLKGDLTVKELLDWFEAKGLAAYSVSCGQSLIYNTIFPKHKERMDKKVSDLVQTVAKLEIPEASKHFDIVVACEDDEEGRRRAARVHRVPLTTSFEKITFDLRERVENLTKVFEKRGRERNVPTSVS